MVNMKTDTSKKISLYGDIKLKNKKSIKTIEIKDKTICNIIECFYETLGDKNIKLSDIEQINLSKIIINKECIACNNKKFWITGYAKKRDSDEKSMRNYFNIENMKLSNLFEEFKIFYDEHLRYFFESIEEIQIIVEGLKIW